MRCDLSIGGSHGGAYAVEVVRCGVCLSYRLSVIRVAVEMHPMLCISLCEGVVQCEHLWAPS